MQEFVCVHVITLWSFNLHLWISCLMRWKVFHMFGIDHQSAPPHRTPLIFAFSVLSCKNVHFLVFFSIIRHWSLSHGTAERSFFLSIQSVMTFPTCCKQRFGVLWWVHRMEKWNWRQKMPFFCSENQSPMNQILKWLDDLLLTTLTWDIRGFGVLG